MKRSNVMLLASVVCGGVAAALAWAYLSTKSAEIDARQEVKSVQILVARQNLEANHALDPERDLKTEIIPAKFAELAQQALHASELEAVRGREITVSIPSGMPLRYAHLAPVAEIGVRPQHRAMSIQVDDAAGLSGLLVPGDTVDILVTRPVPSDDPKTERPPADMNNPMQFLEGIMSSASQATDWTSGVVVEKVRVLAVGRSLTGSRQQLVLGSQGLPSRKRADTVTIEVTQDEAKRILAESAAGKYPLTLLLCPPQDRQLSRSE